MDHARSVMHAYGLDRESCSKLGWLNNRLYLTKLDAVLEVKVSVRKLKKKKMYTLKVLKYTLRLHLFLNFLWFSNKKSLFITPITFHLMLLGKNSIFILKQLF